MPQNRSNESLFRDRVPARSQKGSMGPIDYWLAVDQHPIAVKNNQLETFDSHLRSLFP